MLERAKQLKILIESNQRCLDAIDWALESFETGRQERTGYSTLQRSFHTMKHDALHVDLNRLARLAEAAEAIVERAYKENLALPLDLLRSTSAELRSATETIAAGGRHKLDTKLLSRLEDAVRKGEID